VEGDWPDCQKINAYIHGESQQGVRETMAGFRRWPTWLWANEEIALLAEWMRENRGSFYGLDVYSLFESISVIADHAQGLDPEVARRITEDYSCFDAYGGDEIRYARSLLQAPEGCEDEVVHALEEILALRMEGAASSKEKIFDMEQNARVIKNAEKYYRAMVQGGAESWNIRDRHMIETLDLLLSRKKGKAIIWAHNTHIGDYRYTDMIADGHVNLGGLAREKWGDEKVYLLGMGTYRGTVLAGRAWDAPAERMELPAARPGSYEDYFHKVCQRKNMPKFFLPLKGLKRESALRSRKGNRAVGVVYSPAYERSGHNYVPTVLANRYDGFLFADQTAALRPLAGGYEHGLMPETWPSGM
jgi:erythromycin esterase-like protein